jgi:hypothetical protein
VEAAAAGSYVPAGGGGFGLGRVFLLEGQPEPPASTDHAAQWNVVTPRYFQALGVSLRRGRLFDARDSASSTPVAIVNETMARRVFGRADPIGRRMRSWRDENVLRQIVGVVSDLRYRGLADEGARSLSCRTARTHGDCSPSSFAPRETRQGSQRRFARK